MHIREDLKTLRRKHIKWALEQSEGNQRKAARLLHLPSATFDRWMRELDLGAFAEQLRLKRDRWLVGKEWSYRSDKTA